MCRREDTSKFCIPHYVNMTHVDSQLLGSCVLIRSAAYDKINLYTVEPLEALEIT